MDQAETVAMKGVRQCQQMTILLRPSQSANSATYTRQAKADSERSDLRRATVQQVATSFAHVWATNFGGPRISARMVVTRHLGAACVC